MSRIIFAGTPLFSVPLLEALVHSDLEVVQVLSQPDRPQGRKRTCQPSPVSQCAMAHGLPRLTPTSLKDPELQKTLQDSGADLMVVSAYGQWLPRAVLNIMPCINAHASALPRWRGASPIQQSILHGDTHTALTWMLMDAGLDTGPILAEYPVAIAPEMTSGQLSETLAMLAAQTALDVIHEFLSGTCQPRPQPDTGVTHAPKITKADGQLDLHQSANALERRVRAMQPWPMATLSTRWSDLRIWKASWSDAQGGAVGEIMDTETSLTLQCAQGQLNIHQLQKPGGKPLTWNAFQRGTSWFQVGENIK